MIVAVIELPRRWARSWLRLVVAACVVVEAVERG